MRFMIRCMIWTMVVLFFSAPLPAEEKNEVKTVALLPLAVDEAGPFAYLEESIRQMLASRLFRQDAIALVTPQLSERQTEQIRGRLQDGTYRETAQQMQADWLADGALVALPQGAQVSLGLYPGGVDAAQQRFVVTAADVDEILGAVADLAASVGDYLAERPEAIGEPEREVPVDDGFAAFQTPHPEREFKKGLYRGATMFGEAGDRFQSRGVRRSSPLPLAVESMTWGDLDGNGSNELIVASRGELRIFEFVQEQFRQLARYDFPRGSKIHVVNIGDPGNTGSPRLFVSANAGRAAASAILSWDGSPTLQLRHGPLDWYIRPIDWPGRGELLVGQQANSDQLTGYLADGVYELSLDLQTGRLQRGPRVVLPPDTQLFDFAVADLSGDGQVELAVIDSRQRLVVYDAGLNPIWVSGAAYGGSLRYFGPTPAGDPGDGRPGESRELEIRSLVHIPGRLDVKDVTGDGRPELVVVTNELDPISTYFPNLRTYNGGSVACLGWQGAGLMELWRTSHIAGYVADYVFEEYTERPSAAEPALSRLYVAQLPDIGSWRQFLPGFGTSTMILAYEMLIQRDQESIGR